MTSDHHACQKFDAVFWLSESVASVGYFTCCANAVTVMHVCAATVAAVRREPSAVPTNPMHESDPNLQAQTRIFGACCSLQVGV